VTPFWLMRLRHSVCCRPAARAAVRRATAGAGGIDRVWVSAYQDAGARGCSLSGWRRRLMLYWYAANDLGWHQEGIEGCRD